MENIKWDVVIVGGSYAGLSSALILGRALRNVLVIDIPKPGNISSSHVHGLFSRDGNSYETLLIEANRQLSRYKSIEFLADYVSDLQKAGDNQFVVKTEKITLQTRCVILATGVKDILPDIAGLKALWGTSVFHCPYCQGWEVKNQKLALIGTEDLTLSYIKLIHLWSQDLTVFSNGINFSEEELYNLKSLGISVIHDSILKVSHIDPIKCEIRYSSGKKFFRKIFLKPSLSYSNALAVKAGCKTKETGEVIVDEFQQTTISGIYAIGDLANPPTNHKLAMATATGTKAGIAINNSLVNASTHVFAKEYSY